jgi:hypothetical protein
VVQSAIVAPKSGGAFNNPAIFTSAADDFTAPTGWPESY